MAVRRPLPVGNAQPGKKAFPAVAVSKSLIALALAIGSLTLAGAGGAAIGGSTGTIAACLAILIFGLPHGSLDLEILKHHYAAGAGSMIAVLLLYLGLAFTMWALWQGNPVAALAVFLGIAILHFSEDWPETGSAFLAQGMACAMLAAPVWFHGGALRDAFVALSGTSDAALVADMLLLLAPVSLAVAVVAMWTLWQTGHRQRAMTAAFALVGLIVLPPVIGFACFFCLYHSPRHFSEAIGRMTGIRHVELAVGLVTLAALGLAVVLFLATAGVDLPARFIAASFLTLSLLTVPHMLVPLLVEAVAAKRRRIASYPLQGDRHAYQGSTRIRA